MKSSKGTNVFVVIALLTLLLLLTTLGNMRTRAYIGLFVICILILVLKILFEMFLVFFGSYIRQYRLRFSFGHLCNTIGEMSSIDRYLFIICVWLYLGIRLKYDKVGADFDISYVINDTSLEMLVTNLKEKYPELEELDKSKVE